jgi:acyl dehydratase
MVIQEENMETENQLSTEIIHKAAGHIVKRKPLVHLTELLGLSKEKEDFFQEKIMDLTKTTAKVMVREIAPIWAEISHDHQDIHLDKTAALNSKLAKFKDTPIHGTRTSAHGGGYISKVLDEINSYSPIPFVCTGKIVKFKDVLYPDEALLWNISRATKSENGLELSIVGSTEKGKVVIEIPTLKLGPGMEELSKQELYSHYFRSFKFSSKTITDDTLKRYDFCLNSGESNKIPMALVEALVPAALLELSL